MKLNIIISTPNPETNWNALRLANLAITKGDEVGIFLLGEGVEYEKFGNEKFNIKDQVDIFLQSDRAKILACGTCLKLRHQESSESCPISGLEDLYSLVADADKLLTF